jgi:hypothetical protein
MTPAFALKEWAVLCEAMLRGRQSITLRKGGIEEEEGEFRPRHAAFYLYPTREHQKEVVVRAEDRGLFGVLPPEEKGKVTLSLWAECVWMRPVPSAAIARRLADETIWTPDAMEERFNLYPGKPLWLLVLRTYRLAAPVTLPEDASYAGCRSWVPLVDLAPPDPANLVLTVANDRFHERLDRLKAAAASDEVR